MKNNAVRWLYKHTEHVHGKFFLSVILNVLTSIYTVLFALLMKELIDHAVSRDFFSMTRYGIYIFALTVFFYIAHVISRMIQESITVETMNDLRTFLISSLMNKEYKETQNKHSGEWMNLLFSDIKIISEGVSSIIPGIAGMASKLIFSLITLIVLEPVLALVYLIGGTVIMFGVGLFRGKLKQLHRAVQEKEDRLHVFLQEILENILIIKVFGAEKHFEQKAKTVQQEYADARIRRRKYRLISVNIFSFAFRMGYLAALFYGGYQLFAGSVTYGTLTAVLHIISQMQTPIFNLSGMLPRIYETIASTERVMIVDAIKEEQSSDQVKEFNGLEIEHLSYAYDRDDVIMDSSFAIKKNDIVAITGISGGGKSTLFLLLLGILKPNEGEVTVYTENGPVHADRATRSLFSYVPQGNALFTGSIRDNIVFNQMFDAEKLEYALKTADAYDFVMSFPEKDQTLIGERGTGLSEGQVQRIAIARALYSDAPVILLDESTSALDEETEAKVLHNIKDLNNKTVLIVTHRPAALSICSRHLQIDQHMITEISYQS